MNAINKKLINANSDGSKTYMYSIEYDTDGTYPAIIANKVLVGGTPTTIGDVRVVKFNRVSGKDICLRYDNRPDLAALVAEYQELEAENQAAQEARWAAEAAAREAADKPLLDAMHREVEALVAAIPADHVRVTVKQTGDLDGWPILAYSVDGVTIPSDLVTRHGCPCAIRPGALSEFAIEYVCSIDRKWVDTIRAVNESDAEAIAAKKEARAKELLQTAIPEDAIACYRRYHGDADAAWEDENETAWAIIGKWAPYIEAQYGVDSKKLSRVLADAAREEHFGVNEG